MIQWHYLLPPHCPTRLDVYNHILKARQIYRQRVLRRTQGYRVTGVMAGPVAVSFDSADLLLIHPWHRFGSGFATKYGHCYWLTLDDRQGHRSQNDCYNLTPTLSKLAALSRPPGVSFIATLVLQMTAVMPRSAGRVPSYRQTGHIATH
jgi:hypothetical protein